MKKLVALSVLLVFAMGMTIETSRYNWRPLRTSVTADDTALDGTTESYTFAYDDKPTTAFANSEWNNVQVMFYGTDAANETCNYKIYAYRAYGPAVMVCSGVFTLGTAKTGTTNTFYADTITVTDYWPTEVIVSDSGNNRVCTLTFDLLGYNYVFCEIDIPAASQVASASALISGF